MSCYSPMLITRYYNNDGSKDYKFMGKCSNEDLAVNFSRDIKDRIWFRDNCIIVPCGNCIGCRLDYSATWADRLLCESLDKEAFFITLTYDEENINYSDLSGFPTIKNDDITDFIIQLRNKFRDKHIRYACASEYGDDNLRPHCHFILFGLSFDDLRLNYYKVNGLGQPMYTSEVFDELWKFGFNCVAVASYESMAYTARYIIKKQKGINETEYSDIAIEPPNFRMSRRPGIGYDWFNENYQELFENGFVSVPRNIKASGKITPNRYFTKLLKDKDSSLYWHYKAQSRNDSFQFFQDKLDTSGMSYDNILAFYEFERENFLKRNSLSRKNFT